MRDSNSRPLGPKPSTLAIWANPRLHKLVANDFIVIWYTKSRDFIFYEKICHKNTKNLNKKILKQYTKKLQHLSGANFCFYITYQFYLQLFNRHHTQTSIITSTVISKITTICTTSYCSTRYWSSTSRNMFFHGR